MMRCLYIVLFVSAVDGMSHSKALIARRRIFAALSAPVVLSYPMLPSDARCTDLESCREIGDRKVEEQMAKNPVFRVKNGVRYKVLKPGVGSEVVAQGDTVELFFSISLASGSYMYSQGYGFDDSGSLDYYTAKIGSLDVPVGIEDAIVGMRRGERRRIELPPAVGLETSSWRPAPKTKRGKATIIGYQNVLRGNGSTQPPFPAETVWDVEVSRIRST